MAPFWKWNVILNWTRPAILRRTVILEHNLLFVSLKQACMEITVILKKNAIFKQKFNVKNFLFRKFSVKKTVERGSNWNNEAKSRSVRKNKQLWQMQLCATTSDRRIHVPCFHALLGRLEEVPPSMLLWIFLHKLPYLNILCKIRAN